MIKDLVSDLIVEPSPSQHNNKAFKESKSVRSKVYNAGQRNQDELTDSLGIYK